MSRLGHDDHQLTEMMHRVKLLLGVKKRQWSLWDGTGDALES